MKELKYLQICQAVRAQIAEGFWKPGSRIYSERQLAELYEVSRLTVKRALSELVSEGLLEYRSGRQGTFVSEKRPLREKGTVVRNDKFIGVAVDNHTPAFASCLLQGIHDALWDRGYNTLYCNTYQEYEMACDRIMSLMDTSVAGIIYSPVLGPGYQEMNKQIMSALDEKKIPVVLVDRYLEERLDDYVVTNNRDSYADLVRYLLDKGHSRILYVDGFEATSSRDRLKGFYDAFEKAGADPSGALVIHLDEKDLYRTGRVSDEVIKQVESMGSFSALVGLNQLLLDAGCQIVKKLGLEVVTATAVAGPREKISDYAAVQPIYRMGREAADLLMKKIEDDSMPVTRLILKAEIQDNTGE